MKYHLAWYSFPAEGIQRLLGLRIQRQLGLSSQTNKRNQLLLLRLQTIHLYHKSLPARNRVSIKTQVGLLASKHNQNADSIVVSNGIPIGLALLFEDVRLPISLKTNLLARNGLIGPGVVASPAAKLCLLAI